VAAADGAQRRPLVDLDLEAVDGVRVLVHECTKRPDGWSPMEMLDFHALVFVRRGGFRRRLDGRDDFIGPSMAFFEGRGSELQIRHPNDDGDTTTMVFLSASAARRLAGDIDLPTDVIHAPGSIDLAHRQLIAMLRLGIDRFEAGERLTHLVGALIEEASPGRLTSMRPATRRAHDRILDVAREAITADPASADLGTLADLAGYSPFHVSRVFRQRTGQTLTRFRNRIRVAKALDDLEHGVTDLAGLAAHLGFADQAHMTRVVHAELGVPPGTVRNLLANPAYDRLARVSISGG
jgi:AraC-like DNA-binding protein